MRTYTITLALLILGPFAAAQENGYAGSLGATIGISMPQNDFADTWEKDLFALGGVLTFPARHIPLQLGFDFGYNGMGKKVTTVPVTDPALGSTEGKLAVRAQVLSYHPLLRFSPSKGAVKPYVDGLVGIRHFSTKTTVKVSGLSEPLSKEKNMTDFVLSAGWAAGMMVGLGKTVYIEARVQRFASGNASYVDPASIEVGDSNDISFSTLSSKTGTLSLLFGIGALL